MEIKVDIDYDKINRGFIDLQKASAMATRNTLNIIAAMVRNRYKYAIRKELIIRNTFLTKKSVVAYNKAEGENIASMKSELKVSERQNDILQLQEHGGIRKPKRGGNLAIPQPEARGGSRKKLVGRNYYIRKLKKIKGKYKRNFHSNKARAVARAYVAYHKKRVLKYSDNLFMVVSFNKGKHKVKFKKRHIYNVSEKNAKIKRLPMLARAIEQPSKDSQNIYNSQMNKMLRSKEIF